MTAHATIDGYVADSTYPNNHHHRLQPAWLDAVLRHRGVVGARAGRTPFTLLDLGCGDGVGLAVTAAAYPEARVIGLDALPEHIARGQALVREVGLPNLELHLATFDAALADGRFDALGAHYVTCQGVLAWVSESNQAALMALAACALRPGGVFAVGYNAMPGWEPLLPFQRLLSTLAAALPGTPRERFAAALEQVRVSGLIAADVLARIDEMAGALPADYMAHEYLNGHWAPQWSGDVLTALAARDLNFVAGAAPEFLREDFGLRRAWRDTLAGIAPGAARELALDLLVRRAFRVDLFVRGEARVLAPDDRAAARLGAWWAAADAPEDAPLSCQTPAGTLTFDNDAARAILSRLGDGPAVLAEVAGVPQADLLNTVDALWIAGRVRPADGPAAVPHAAPLDAWLAAAAQIGCPMNARAGTHGTIPVPGVFLRGGSR